MGLILRCLILGLILWSLDILGRRHVLLLVLRHGRGLNVLDRWWADICRPRPLLLLVSTTPLIDSPAGHGASNDAADRSDGCHGSITRAFAELVSKQSAASTAQNRATNGSGIMAAAIALQR